MKILQINKFLKIVGGAETYMFQLSKSLQDLGIEIKFWGMQDAENIVNDFVEYETPYIDFNNQNVLSKISSSFSTIYSNNNRIKLARVLDIYKPDIVHIHNYNFQLTPSILPEIKKRGIKVVQTIHDSQMVCPYHRLFNFQRNDVCTKCVKGSFVNCIKDRCFDGSFFKSTIGAIESTLYHTLGYYEKYIDTFICPSNFLADLIKNRINNKIEVIPNFTKIQTDITKDVNKKEYFLYFGRITEEKGILELIDAFVETKQNLLIVGKGPIDSFVKEKANEHENVNYIGAKYDKELFTIIKNAKWVLQSSKGFENCPMTIIESFALGVPVIASNHSGFKDLIQDGKTGYLVDFTDKSSIITKLLELDQMNVSAVKENIAEYYNKNLTEKVHIEKVLSVYNDLLAK